jgi:hypothetical protein
MMKTRVQYSSQIGNHSYLYSYLKLIVFITTNKQMRCGLHCDLADKLCR